MTANGPRLDTVEPGMSRGQVRPDAATASAAPRIRPLPFGLGLAVALVMAVAYTVHDTLQIGEPAFSLISFIPGVLGVGALLASGLTGAQCNLAPGWFSRRGLVVLAATFLLLLPIVLSNTGKVAWNPLAALVYAPASGIAQELFFRSALLPALTGASGGRVRLALPIHSLIFVAYHFRTFRSVGAIGPATAVAMVLFLAGLGWGWEAQKDRTILWTAIQHSIFLALMSMFTWG